MLSRVICTYILPLHMVITSAVCSTSAKVNFLQIVHFFLITFIFYHLKVIFFKYDILNKRSAQFHNILLAIYQTAKPKIVFLVILLSTRLPNKLKFIWVFLFSTVSRHCWTNMCIKPEYVRRMAVVNWDGGACCARRQTRLSKLVLLWLFLNKGEKSDVF